MLSSHGANTIELATVACLQIDVYTTLGQSDRAVAVCLEYLRHLNIEWEMHPTEEWHAICLMPLSWYNLSKKI